MGGGVSERYLFCTASLVGDLALAGGRRGQLKDGSDRLSPEQMGRGGRDVDLGVEFGSPEVQCRRECSLKGTSASICQAWAAS